MAHLYRHLRVHQVFGANTDVGKTIFTTALCLASAALPLGASSGEALPHNVLQAAQQSLGEQVHYLKPVSTGALSDSDDGHISTFAPNAHYKTLYRFNEPVSPHLAVQLERNQGAANVVPTDQQFVRSVGDWIHAAAAATVPGDALKGVAFVETAGGVHSPGPSGVSQTHLLRPLRLPTILIGSAELGGISTTRSAFESLLVAGYDVEAVLLFPSHRYGNVEYLRQFFAEEHNIPVFGLGGPGSAILPSLFGPPPVRNPDADADQAAMRAYYEGLVRGKSALDESLTKEETPGGVFSVVEHLRRRHHSRITELATMAQRTRDTCWWPFTQHNLTQSNDQVNVIDSAHGDFFAALDQRSGPNTQNLLQPVLDGSASWWTQCLGHAPHRLVTAAAAAAGRYGHVLFPNGTHKPALLLAEQLTGKTAAEPAAVPSAELMHSHPGAGWASRVFFSDDGSTGMEVALKMALQSAITRYTYPPSSPAAAARAEAGRQAGYMSGRPQQEWQVLGLKGSYHGDTIGTMDACEPSVYSEAVHWYRGRGYWFDPPTVEIKGTCGGATVSLTVPDADTASQMAQHLPASSSHDGSATVFAHEFASVQDVYDVEARLQSDPLAAFYRASIRAKLEQLIVVEGRKFGALVLEPLVMGAGGMVFVDPLFQRVLIDVVRASEDLFSLTDAPLKSARTPLPSTPSGDVSEWRGIPVIFDEVFAGLYRLGPCTPATVLGVTPDISVLAKILTGGMVPMSVTLASSSIFATFNRSNSKVDALLHGHSYTAHPIGCAVALETLSAISQLKHDCDGGWAHAQADWAGASTAQPRVWSFWSKDAVDRFAQLPNVDHAMAMGCVLKVSLRDDGAGYTSTASVDILNKLRYGPNALQGHPTVPEAHGDATLPFNIHARPLGNVIYLMSSLNTPAPVLRQAETALYAAIQHAPA